MNGRDPVVSVVIPAYNCSDTVLNTIKSVLNQSICNIEILVVDDGSTDNTAETVERISDSRVNLLQHGQNQGRSTARNTGTSAATGEFIAYLDSDDTWCAKKLERQIEILQTRSEDWIAVYCGINYIRPGILTQVLNNVVSRPTGKEGGEELVPDLLMWQLAVYGGSTLLVKSNVAKKIDGWDTNLHHFEDIGYVVQLLEEGKIAYVDEPLVHIHDSGKSDAVEVEHELQKFLEAYSKRVKSLEADGFPVTEAYQFMLAKYQFSSGDFISGVQSLRASKCPHIRDALGLIKAIGEGLINIHHNSKKKI